MSRHWWFVVLAYAVTLGVFAWLSVASLRRHRAVRRKLAALEKQQERPAP